MEITRGEDEKKKLFDCCQMDDSFREGMLSSSFLRMKCKREKNRVSIDDGDDDDRVSVMVIVSGRTFDTRKEKNICGNNHPSFFPQVEDVLESIKVLESNEYFDHGYIININVILACLWSIIHPHLFEEGKILMIYLILFTQQSTVCQSVSLFNNNITLLQNCVLTVGTDSNVWTRD